MVKLQDLGPPKRWIAFLGFHLLMLWRPGQGMGSANIAI